MAVTPGGQMVSIKEQIIEDEVSGLTLQFEVMPDGTGRLRVYGDLPLGNREIVFSAEGEEAGGGTALASLCRPSWLNVVS